MRRLSLNRSEPAKKSGHNIPKNRCRTTIAERMVETLAELPFIGDEVVCLSHDRAARSGPAGIGREEQTSPRPDARLPGCDRIAPLVDRFGSEYPERRARDKMALKVEDVVDGRVHAEKTLGEASRFEPLHLRSRRRTI
jgi:hypothetical protein